MMLPIIIFLGIKNDYFEKNKINFPKVTHIYIFFVCIWENQDLVNIVSFPQLKEKEIKKIIVIKIISK